ncbi:hypothetical protein HanPSC8_Chr16g0694531 [Helianthus annuus]|nr:hypothetical protein HanPSC8_Chr16g0694531 [Helianthus annuus]
MCHHLYRKKPACHCVTCQEDARQLHPDEVAGIFRSCFWYLIDLHLSISANETDL